MKVRITLLATILLATAFTFACGYIDPKCKPNVDCVGIIEHFKKAANEKDSVKCYADSLRISNDSIAIVLDSLKRLISENSTTDAMIKSQEFYSDSFGKIQDSYMFFLTCIGIFATILTAFAFFDHFKIMNEFNKYDKKLYDLEDKIKQEIANQKNSLEAEKNSIFRDIAIVYFASAVTYFKLRDWMLHFTYLTQHYNFIIDKRLELLDVDMECLKQLLYDFIKTYEEIKPENVDCFFYKYTQRYLYTLEKLIMYCQETNKQEHLAVAKKLRDKLTDIFDSINQKSPTTGDPS